MIAFLAKDGKTTLMVEGALLTITTEINAMVREIYKEVKKNDEDAAETMKDILKRSMEDGIMFDKDPKEALGELLNEMSEMDEFKELFEGLKGATEE